MCTSPRLPERPDAIEQQSPWQKWINQTPLAHLSLFGGLIGKEAGVNKERRETEQAHVRLRLLGYVYVCVYMPCLHVIEVSELS